MPEAERTNHLATLDDATKAALAHHWPFWARPNQVLPDGAWTYWLILAGRGFGKTRTGAETVRQWVRESDMVNLIGATVDDARDIMIEGESGILAICPKDERPEYRKSERKLVWPNGATSLIFTADEPERLRGKQHKKLWADEMCAWRYAEAWDQAQFGLRLGGHPQAVITTTPKPVPVLKKLLSDKATTVTRGSTYDNKANLAPSFFDAVIKRYEGTRLGRQELNAEILEDVQGALWSRSMIQYMPRPACPLFKRIVVAIDPPATSNEGSNECGIVVVGIGVDDNGYVLADRSGVMSPQEWSIAAVTAFREYEADLIVAEANQGGEMIEAVIHSVGSHIPVKLVRASRGKIIRAEPISAIYARNKVWHVGQFEALEDQMCSYTPDMDRKNGSPDRLDALVWGFTELFPSLIADPVQIDTTPDYGGYSGSWMA